ncbi:exonuclease domain-containing protein [Sinosporangium siamense]|uniref:Exonuclease domain-containing protein n=1 Tax=Sinosporangium siamense TaxID=1367973 RepID=A0A919RIA0_9ACTN|nr:exonuclease domain-containing protein [Sinosporangium siamense]GII93807.1 hypothetical protein Ssi02_40380 [Sinosporangium siamense]
MAGGPPCYAVLDLETTGLWPHRHDRVVEIGVVHLSRSGEPTGRWSTLVNPERDLGAQHIHGISAADVLHAPTFAGIAGELVDLLRGRVPVAHNLAFDLDFLTAEFARLGFAVPLRLEHGVCTMEEAPYFLPHMPRTLADCCAVAGIRHDVRHDALADAEAAAGLLRTYLASAGPLPHWDHLFETAMRARWPEVPRRDAPRVRRGVAAERQGHFTARVPDPSVETPADAAEIYLTLLDRVLLDHHVSAAEADSLVEVATSVGLGREEVRRLHLEYLSARAHGGTAPRDLATLAALLGVQAEDAAGVEARPGRVIAWFELRPGDMVVFTGDMEGGREAWEALARKAGYVPHSGVTKKVRLVVAADPDSLSGKARKARAYGIPIVTPGGFSRLVRDSRT